MKEFLKTADILLPDIADYTKWSVVACDQFTGDRKYWEDLKKITEGSPSALNLILPEAYLSEDNSGDIKKINRNMHRYLEEGIFKSVKGAVLTERTFPSGVKRVGIVACIDLEDYDFAAGSKSPVRATEGTVLDRIPPRLKIRENAPVELPHIMILAEDETNEIFLPLYENRDSLTKLYDFELNMNGGHLKGYLLESLDKINRILDKKYVNIKNPFVFAVGDGNHSLATAKTMWENIKKSADCDIENHPARFALAEIVNLYDSGLIFEPIHRIVYNADCSELAEKLRKYSSAAGKYGVSLLTGGKILKFEFDMEVPDIYKTVQTVLDDYTALHKNCCVDYIHGEDALKSLAEKENAAGLLMPCLNKNGFFGYIAENGALPRKTFSMGEANEKRYYTEARKIF